MCQKCGQTPKYPISFQQNPQIKYQQTVMFASMVANVAGGIFSLINAINTNNSSYTEPVSAHRKESKVETPEENPENIETQKNAVKNLIGETAFNNLTDDFKTEVLKKYSTITTYAQNNNIEISDAEMARRLNNYITALKAHEQELKFGEHLISNGADAVFTGESIIYDDIATEKVKPPSPENDNAYYATLLNRGIGTVQLYDTNGDNKVSRDEFLAKEKADWKKLTGEDITSKMENATKALFNRINKDNDTEFLSNAELGAFEYARATTGDVSTNSNQELTYEEWYLSSSGIGVSDEITSDFERAQNQIYQILENRDKPI